MKPVPDRALRAATIATTTLLAACGGGSSNPLDNPTTVVNTAAPSGQRLSFAYFQKCINPILIAQLPIPNGSGTNTCAGSGCHDTTTGTGGALRIVPGAQPLDVADPNAKLIAYWISHPAPLGQDEFSTATWAMFTPADPNTGTCNTQ